MDWIYRKPSWQSETTNDLTDYFCLCSVLIGDVLSSLTICQSFATPALDLIFTTVRGACLVLPLHVVLAISIISLRSQAIETPVYRVAMCGPFLPTHPQRREGKMNPGPNELEKINKADQGLCKQWLLQLLWSTALPKCQLVRRKHPTSSKINFGHIMDWAKSPKSQLQNWEPW